MGVEVNDFRELRKRQLEKEGRQMPPMLEQAEAESVGDDRLDKMLRALAAMKEESAKHVIVIAQKVASAVEDKEIRRAQLYYFLEQGKLQTLEAVMQIPAQIMAESKPVIHS